MTPQHTSIGVVLTQDAKGKFAAYRVFLDGDNVVKRELLTDSRAPSWAVKAARENLERLVSDWQRGVVDFAQPEFNKLKIEEHTRK